MSITSCVSNCAPVFCLEDTIQPHFDGIEVQDSDRDAEIKENAENVQENVEVANIALRPIYTQIELFYGSISADKKHPIKKLSMENSEFSKKATDYWMRLAFLFHEQSREANWTALFYDIANLQQRARDVAAEDKLQKNKVSYFMLWPQYSIQCNADGSIFAGDEKVVAQGSFKKMHVIQDIINKKLYASLETSYWVKKDFVDDLDCLVASTLTDTPGVVNLLHIGRNANRLAYENKKGELKELTSVSMLQVRTTFLRYEQTLHQYLKAQDKRRIEDPRELLKLIKQFSIGLNNIHQKGIIHRDIKPNNLLVDKKLTACITDFGAAVFLKAKLSRRVSNSNYKKMGLHSTTSLYADPLYCKAFRVERSMKGIQILYDQKKLKGAMTEKLDVFSLGCVFYEMRNGLGSLPWAKGYRGARDDLAMMGQIASLQNDWFPVKEEETPSIPVLISWMTQPDPNHRPFMHEVIEYIETIPSIDSEEKSPD